MTSNKYNQLFGEPLLRKSATQMEWQVLPKGFIGIAKKRHR